LTVLLRANVRISEENMAKGGVFFAGMLPWAGLPGGQGGASRRAGGKPVALIWETSATDL